jgi:hypothetical protein
VKGHIDALQDGAAIVGKINVADFYQGCGHLRTNRRVKRGAF